MVFPEDGLYGYYIRNRWYIRHYLEPIPDPLNVFWIPCNEPMRFPQDEVQVFLSCLAKRNNMYIVANMGDIQACQPGDPQCPTDGFYQYNTNVAYDRDGKLIAKYHKQNRYYEPQFNAPVHPEHSYFDTDFGRFGLIVCNDIMFFDPVIELIRKYNVTDIVFPTAWSDYLPLYTLLGYISSFATGHSVNVLAANIREPTVPTRHFHGSGMFTPAGAVKYIYDTVSQTGHLLIADVLVNIRTAVNLPCDANPMIFGHPEMTALVDSEFKAALHKDWYDFVIIKGAVGTITVCQLDFCCYLHYERTSMTETYAFGVFSGVHMIFGPIYQQICVLTRCPTDDPQSCGQPVASASTHFAALHMKGSFESPFVQPLMILSGPFNKLELPPIGSFQYGPNGYSSAVTGKPLIHAALICRVYRKDCMTCK